MDETIIFGRQSVIDLTQAVTEYFKGKTDKCGYPYIAHCLIVAQYSADLARQYYGKDNTFMQYIAYIVGLCHDCYEDLDQSQIEKINKIIIDQIPSRAGDIIHWIDLLTHDKDQSYSEYIEQLTKSKLATIVKAADSYHNSLSERYQYVVTKLDSVKIDKAIGNCERYKSRHKALIELLEHSVFVEP